MNYLTFLRIRLFDAKAHIEAPLRGRWQLIKNFETDYRHSPGEFLVHGTEITETLWLEIRDSEASFYFEPASEFETDETGESGRVFCPFQFDAQSGLLVIGSRFFRVLRLTDQELTLLVLAKLGWGIVSEEKYRREEFRDEGDFHIIR